jgi:hypothetical protein
MWSIHKLIENNFDKFLEKSLIIPRKRYTNKSDLIYSHTLYDVRFLHDFSKNLTNEQYSEFQERYRRRIERFQTLLDSRRELLFFRLEQNHHKRIQYEEFQEYIGDEKVYLEKFAETMINKKVNYTIIYFTTSTPRHVDKEKRIIYVQFGKKNLDIEIGLDELKAICIAKNLKFHHKAGKEKLINILLDYDDNNKEINASE